MNILLLSYNIKNLGDYQEGIFRLVTKRLEIMVIFGGGFIKDLRIDETC